MQIENEIDLIEFNNWHLRIRKPANSSSGRVLLLLHGWSGDENSMWVFAKDIPQDYWVISPRAPYSTGAKGFSWRNVKQVSTWGAPTISDLQPALNGLVVLIEDWAVSNSVDLRSIDLIGFSQGAALVCTLLLSDRVNIEKAACLAGFMPDGGKEEVIPGMLKGKKIFVSHGIGDEVVPLSRGQEMVEILEYAGADVDLCAEEAGHRVGIQCFKGLKNFFCPEGR